MMKYGRPRWKEETIGAFLSVCHSEGYRRIYPLLSKDGTFDFKGYIF